MSRSMMRSSIWPRADIWGLGIAAALAPWISVLFPRGLGGLLPVAALAAVAGFYYVRRRLPIGDRSLWLAGAVVILLCGASALWSPDAGYGLERTAKIASTGALALLLLGIAGGIEADDRRRRLWMLFGAAYALGLGLTAVNVLSGGALYLLLHDVTRADDAVTASNRAMVALILLLWPALLAMVECRALFPKGSVLLPGALVVAMVLTVTLLTDSQSALLGLLAGLLTLAGASFAPMAMRLAVQYGGAALILAMPWLVLGMRALDPSFSGDWQAASSSARIEIWSAVAGRVFERPIVGHGLEAARFVPDWGMANIYYPAAMILHPHNGPLQVWFEMGAVGALVAVALWWLLIRRLGQLSGLAHHLALAMAGVALFVSTVSHGLWQSWWLGLLGFAVVFFRLGQHWPPRG